MLESLFDKVAALQPSNFIKERLQHRCFPVNIAKFLTTPILKNICELLLLLIVIFSRENKYMQPCFDLPEPKLHKKLIWIMLVIKIMYNFVWIYLGRSSRSEVFCKRDVFRKVTGLCIKETLVQVFLVNFYRTPVVASVCTNIT